MSKLKAKIGFGDDLDEIQANPEVVLDDENFKSEFSRNLLHKNIYEKSTIEPG